MKSRVIAYVDGFNLFFGLRAAGLREGYWLDVPQLIRRVISPSAHELIGTKYFTSRITGDPGKAMRQTRYLEAMESLAGVSLYFGQFQTHTRRCQQCGACWEHSNEKMTDVNIAVELLTDALEDAFDTAFLISADSDLSAPIKAIRRHWPAKRLMLGFPPHRGSVVLAKLAHERRRLTSKAVLACQMPDEVPGRDGYPRRRPAEWGGPPADPGLAPG